MELDESAVVEFRSPIFGFDHLQKYVLLSDDEMGPGLIWLQSLDDPGVCFILLDPEEIGLEYTPEIGGDVAQMLEIEEAPVVRVIAVVPQDFKKTTVNLKSPIIINQGKKWAAQVILDADYPIKLPLFDGGA